VTVRDKWASLLWVNALKHFVEWAVNYITAPVKIVETANKQNFIKNFFVSKLSFERGLLKSTTVQRSLEVSFSNSSQKMII
jgi:hypothetical protein